MKALISCVVAVAFCFILSTTLTYAAESNVAPVKPAAKAAEQEATPRI